MILALIPGFLHIKSTSSVNLGVLLEKCENREVTAFTIIHTVTATLSWNEEEDLTLSGPKAKRIPHALEAHGDVRDDPYYWLRNRENPEVIQYLEAENAFYQEHMAPLEDLTNKLFEGMVARIPDVELKVPVQSGHYYYYTRTEKELQYPIFARKRARNREELKIVEEQILLNLNELATDGGYLSVTVQRMSPDESRLAYLENRDGTDRYTLFIKDVQTNTCLPDRVSNVFIGNSMEWDATGAYIFYVTVDESQRPYQLWRHTVGSTGSNQLLYEEKDNTFTLTLGKSRSGKYLFVRSASKTSSEIRYLNAENATSELQLFDERRPDIEYELEHWGDDFLILTNENAKNFCLLRCKVNQPGHRKALIDYDEKRYLQDVYPFASGLVLSGRENGLTEVWLYQENTLSKLHWDEPLYTVSVGDNRSYDATEILIQYESLLTPKTTYAVGIGTIDRICLQVMPVAGHFEPSDYVQERLFATATDGTQVPMNIVYQRNALTQGPAPLVLYGYGSYGMNSDPRFDAMRLPLLDEGVVFVTAQIRGGSEMGYSWYEDGKLLSKKNTFTDFIDCAKDLITRGYTTPEKLAARGGSAGGLLVGAVSNMAPLLFKVIAPAVPFVDVITTMLDASIPLTTLEYDEWGNPEHPEYYDYMKSYSPYDNVARKAYPHMLVTTGLNDPRVAYWEPAKWVARLREMKTDDNVLLLKTNMGAGHFGASGRFDQLKEVAAGYAFIFDKLGIKA